MLLICRGYIERVCPRSPLIKHVAQRRHLNTKPYLDLNYLPLNIRLTSLYTHNTAIFKKPAICDDKGALTIMFTYSLHLFCVKSQINHLL